MTSRSDIYGRTPRVTRKQVMTALLRGELEDVADSVEPDVTEWVEPEPKPEPEEEETAPLREPSKPRGRVLDID